MDSRRRQISLVFIATDVGQNLRTALEAIVVVAIIILLTSLGLQAYKSQSVHSQISEAYMLTSMLKADLIVYRAEHGHWPATDAEFQHSALDKEQNAGRYVDHIALDESGSITVVFGANHAATSLIDRRLSFRPMTNLSSPGSPLFWACANYRAPNGFTTSGQDKTDIETALLPSACRSN